MKYNEEYTVKSNEADIHNALRPTQLIQYMQETADHQMRDQDIDYVKMHFELRKAFVVSRMSVEVLESIGMYDHIDATTWITEGRAANFPRAYELMCDGRVKARAMSNWALLDIDTHRLVRNGEYDMSSYAKDSEPKLTIPTKFRIPRDVELKEVDRVRVGYSMIDINRHLNNAQYADMLHDRIPGVEDLYMTSINLHFQHEAPYGSEVVIRMSDFLDAGKMDPRAEKIVYFATEVNGGANIEAVFGLKKFVQ